MDSEVHAKPKKLKASDHESYGTLSIISFILPFVGIILGIVYLTKDDKLDKKLGEHLIAFSVLAFILWGIVYAVFIASQDVNQIQQIQL